VKIAVLTDPESAAGYRLAGLQVVVAPDPAAAREELGRLIQSDEYALIAVDSALVPDPYQAVKKEIRGRDLPVLLAVPPSGAAAGAGEDAEGYIRRLLKETMGYEIKL
jgi:V/A-type H+/Na+-transporting ATPase subunit F